MVKSLADNYTGKLKDYKPFGQSSFCLGDRLSTLIRDTAASYMNEPYPVISATDYMRLVRCGNRSEYEAKYFARRYKLNALVAGYYCNSRIIDGTADTSMLDEIIDGIWAICEESSWCLPAHNTYVRDTPQIILPDTERPVMDLFACETGATLSMVSYLLKDELDKVSPLICERIYKEVCKRIINPYVTEHFWWMGNGDEPMCNWTVWCIQNSLLCAFLLPCEDSARQVIYEKACYGIDCFLKDYGDDGCCEEGAQYFRHAGLCLFGCLDILNSITDGHFQSLFTDAKIRNIAEYIVNVHIGGKYYVNYADCSPLAGNCGIREFLFGRLCKLPSLTGLAAHDYADSLESGQLFEDESVKLNLYYRMQTIFYSEEILDAALSNNSINTQCKSVYYDSVGVGLIRSDCTLAVKSGDNNDSHNHNDTGSIILYKGLDPIFVDIGPMTYTQKTFSDKRYEIWALQSCYHNLPTIDGTDQMAGSEYTSSDVKVDIDNNKLKQISMNIAGAYPLKDRTITYTRTAGIDMIDNSVILSDICSKAPYDLENGIILNFITYHKPLIDENSKVISIGSAIATYEGASSPVVEVLTIDDARLRKSWDHDLYRIRLTMTSNEFKMIVR